MNIVAFIECMSEHIERKTDTNTQTKNKGYMFKSK